MIMNFFKKRSEHVIQSVIRALLDIRFRFDSISGENSSGEKSRNERGDVPGWVLVVLMTTGLVTAIWTIAAPRLTAILRNSLDSMNGIR
jgi:hypothetical protein